MKTGDLVNVRVLKHIDGRRWAVSFRGRVFTAVTDIGLNPATILRARVEKHARGLLLRIRNESTPVDVPETIIASLLRSGIKPSTRVWRALRLITGDSKDRKRARLISLMLEKNIDPTSRGWDRLFRILAFGGGGDGQNRSRENLRDLAKRLRKALVRKAVTHDDEHPLHLFNHLKGMEDTWVMAPLRMGDLEGFLKLLVTRNSRRPRRVVLDVSDGKAHWSFLLVPNRSRIRLRVFCSENGLRHLCSEKIPQLRSKLQNHGVECDDSIYDEKEFDGFSPIWEGVGGHQIDTYR